MLWECRTCRAVLLILTLHKRAFNMSACILWKKDGAKATCMAVRKREWAQREKGYGEWPQWREMWNIRVHLLNILCQRGKQFMTLPATAFIALMSLEVLMESYNAFCLSFPQWSGFGTQKLVSRNSIPSKLTFKWPFCLNFFLKYDWIRIILIYECICVVIIYIYILALLGTLIWRWKKQKLLHY